MLHDKEKGNEAVDGDYGQTVVSAYLDCLKIFTVLYASALTIHSVSYYDRFSSKSVKSLRQKRPFVRRLN